MFLRFFPLWVLGISLALILFIVLSEREPLFLMLNGVSRITGDLPWAVLTNCGDGLIAAAFLPLFLRAKPQLLKSTLIAALLSFPLIQITKRLLLIHRPGELLPHAHIIGTLPHSFSFPSGHSATAGVIFGVLALLSTKKRERSWWIGFALLVGFSRIAVGVHWPLDVVVGLALGFLCAWGGVALNQKPRPFGWGSYLLLVLLMAIDLSLTVEYHANPALPLFVKAVGGISLIFCVINAVYFSSATNRNRGGAHGTYPKSAEHHSGATE